jgi:PAS domain S-box-containing protein
MHGLKHRDDAIGQRFSEIQMPGSAMKPDQIAEALLRGESIRNREYSRLCHNGTMRHLSFSSTPIVDGDRVIGVEGFFVDITEWKRTHDALRTSEETFHKLFRFSPAVVTLSNQEDGRFIEVNNSFERVTGYRREEAIRYTPKELGLWADPVDFDESVKQLRAAGRLHNLVHRFRRKNGDVGIGLTSLEMIELDRKSCVLSATLDITDQKKAEATMTSLVTAIEHGEEQIVVTDLDGTIQYCNPAFEKVTGYSKDEVVGQNPRLLKSGKHSIEFYRELWATLTNGDVWRGHLTNKKKDGTLYEEEATFSPIRDALGRINGFVAIKRDVTERLELERQLLQAQKLESVGRLAGGVAHDFNNLLTVIKGYSEFLIKELKPYDPLLEHAHEIRQAGERAESLTKQLLAFGRKQVVAPRPLDLNTIIRDTEQMLQRLIGEDIVLTSSLRSFLWPVMADPNQIHQVIMNLAVNARDAMPDGGKLDIETTNVDLDKEGIARCPEATSGHYVLMTVTDTGHGMDETIRQQIFEPFYTTKEVGKGTGLGLSTVYGIIRQSGGWIDVSSTVGVGTSFRVYLPRTDACPLEETIGSGALTQGGAETILVVEDQRAVRLLTKKVLEKYGYRVIEACDAQEAIAAAKNHGKGIHLLVTDVVLTGMNGRALSCHLKSICPNMRVLLMSGYATDVLAPRGVVERGMAFLPKPFSPNELAAKVREVLGQSLSGLSV